MKNYGPNVTIPRTVLLKDILRQAPQFLSSWRRLKWRARRHEVSGAALVLVEFTAP